jgi:hypothetical protein
MIIFFIEDFKMGYSSLMSLFGKKNFRKKIGVIIGNEI